MMYLPDSLEVSSQSLKSSVFPDKAIKGRYKTQKRLLYKCHLLMFGRNVDAPLAAANLPNGVEEKKYFRFFLAFSCENFD